jgi:hypothetical protein
LDKAQRAEQRANGNGEQRHGRTVAD